MTTSSELLELTVQLVASFVAQNTVAPGELPGLIRTTHATLVELLPDRDRPQQHKAPASPAVPVDKSVTRDYIVCLDDGRRLKTLKRYLRRKYSLTPEEYRARWRLPDDYPMVAPAYAELRSTLARRKSVQPGMASARPVKNGPRKP
jgi:predicted transcriptional regulator